MSDVKVKDDRVVEISMQPYRNQITDAAVVLNVSAEDAERPRYRAGYTMPVCDHKHRSAMAAARCAISFSIGVYKRLSKGEAVKLSDKR